MASSDKKYYTNQLERMNVNNEIVKFKFMSDDNTTNVMNLNLDSIEALEKFIQESKKILEKFKKEN